MPSILGANTLSSGYDVANSLRFDDGSSPYLTRTISSGADMTAFTFSFWVKRSTLGTTQRIISSDHTDSKDMYIRFESDDTFGMYHRRTDSENVISGFGTAAKFRDTSAWYHFVINMDSNESTEADRLKMYVNGTRVTTFAGTVHYPTSGEYANFFNSSEKTDIGYYRTGTSEFFDGYLAEVVAIQGTAYQASDFGEFDEDSPTIWKPKDVSGLTFGTNGFYHEFQQSGTSQNSSGLGADTSGNDNHFATSGLAATDQSTDTCTNNFATLNPLIYESRDNTFAEGNLKITGGGSDSWTNHYGVSTIAVSSGKWFVEAKMTTTVGSQGMLGIIGTSTALAGSLRDFGPANIDAGGRISGGGGDHQTGLTAFADGNIAGAAFDATNGTIQFYRNGSAYGNAVSSIASDTYYFVTNSYDAGAVVEFNFGSPPYSESGGNSDANGYGNFSMAVPNGYYALNTKNLAEFG